MILNPTLAISLDRSSMAGSPTPLLFSAAMDATPLGIVSYQPPAHLNNVTYAPPSMNVAGSEAIGVSLQQAALNFDWMMDGATTESEIATAYADVIAALNQFGFPLTVTISDAPGQVWACDSGSASPPARTYVDLANPNAWVCAVTIPVYPIPSTVES